MALSKKTIQAIGVGLSSVFILTTGFLVVSPLNNSTNENKELLENEKIITLQNNLKLATLKKGVSGLDETKEFVEDFLESAPKDKDIESASRSISKALVSGVSIKSFSFGGEQNIDKIEIPKATLDEYKPPFSLDTPATGSDGKEKESLDSFHRMPMQVTVTANSYNDLSKYLDSLAEQKRLIYVVGVNSNKGGVAGSDGSIEATVYSYAYIYSNSN